MTLVWRRSSYSGSGGTGGGNCVEAAHLGTGGFALRDSKNHATVLALPHDGMTSLLRHIAR